VKNIAGSEREEIFEVTIVIVLICLLMCLICAFYSIVGYNVILVYAALLSLYLAIMALVCVSDETKFKKFVEKRRTSNNREAYMTFAQMGANEEIVLTVQRACRVMLGEAAFQVLANDNLFTDYDFDDDVINNILERVFQEILVSNEDDIRRSIYRNYIYDRPNLETVGDIVDYVRKATSHGNPA